jgi:hypothetical protein
MFGLPLRTIFQLLSLAGAAGLAITWSLLFRREPGLARRLLWALPLYGAFQLAFILYLWFNHAAFPLNLEAMELTVLQHVRRILAGLPLYPPPAPEFIPLAYNPGFYYLSIPFTGVFGPGLLALRLAAIAGMAGCLGLVFWWLKQSTGATFWGLLGAGLFVAAYRSMDCYLDNAHGDSWMLLLILFGLYSVGMATQQGLSGAQALRRGLAGTACLCMAFWFKQSAALFAAGGVLYLTLRLGWRQAWPAWLAAAVLGPGLYLAAGVGFGADFYFYTWQVPRQWAGLNAAAVLRWLGQLAGVYPFLALAALAGAIGQEKTRAGLPPLQRFAPALLALALLSGLSGALDSESNDNIFIPMGALLILLGIQAVPHLLRRSAALERLGLAVLVAAGSFAVFIYNPLTVIIPPDAPAAYADLTAELHSLDGPVYAPWLGQLAEGYQFSPAAHWVPLTDLFRGPGVKLREHPTALRLLAPVAQARPGYILLHAPLEVDPVLAFLGRHYTLEKDYGERFAALATLPRRYYLGYPRYLYRTR